VTENKERGTRPLPKAGKTRTGRRKVASRNTYDDVLDAATTLFARIGYERTSVRAISSQLGIESGSLYSHISSKEEILLKIVERTARTFFTAAERAVDPSANCEEQLRALCAAHLSVVHSQPEAVAVYYNNWKILEGEYHQQIVDLRRRYENIFTEVVTSGKADGSFGDVDAADAALVILSTLNWTPEWYSPSGLSGPDQIAARLADVLLQGLRSR
jgi:TetR/AcrR family transcriptional regulator, cholesterol catabolism regulator